MDSASYVTTKPCPLCGNETHVVRMRARLPIGKTDPDFCVHYNIDESPYFYHVWVCENCGYAADENSFQKPLRDSEKDALIKHLSEHPVSVPFVEKRTKDDIVLAYKLAIFYGEIIGAKASHAAGLYLRLGWSYRILGDEAGEKDALTKAASLYDQALSKERFPIGKMSETMVTYLIAALNNRIGETEKATRYLSDIISNNNIRDLEPNMFKKARDLWQEIRA